MGEVRGARDEQGWVQSVVGSRGGGVTSRCRDRVCGVGRSSRGGMDRLGYFVT